MPTGWKSSDVIVVPTYHPAWIMRGQWVHQATVICDFERAKSAVTRGLTADDAQLVVPSTASDVHVTLASMARTGESVAIDVEGGVGHLLCVGFCQVPPVAVVVPTRRNWWGADEPVVRAALAAFLSSDCPKVFHNGVYDMEVLEAEGWEVNNWTYDTMLLTHLVYPELPKALDFVRSIHTDVQPYKHVVRKKEGGEDK